MESNSLVSYRTLRLTIDVVRVFLAGFNWAGSEDKLD